MKYKAKAETYLEGRCGAIYSNIINRSHDKMDRFYRGKLYGDLWLEGFCDDHDALYWELYTMLWDNIFLEHRK
jgi:hypothetical protein